eukprot:jgi/Picsp_1/3654/NSC_06491-R1_ankyrin repeat domain-containing protein 50
MKVSENYCSKRYRIQVIEVLCVKLNANVDVVDLKGRTVLMLTAGSTYGGTITKTLLSKAKPNVNASDNEEKTVLMYAAEGGHVNVVETLIRKNKANVHATDKQGNSASCTLCTEVVTTS